MNIKSISYQRVLNLGNYESKRLELVAEVLEGEEPEEAISRLAETVERKIREDKESTILTNIRKLEQQANFLKQEVAYLEEKRALLKDQQSNLTEPNSSDTPDF